MSTSGALSRIVDIAVRYRAGLTPLQNGHYTVYHDDLAAVARRLGHDVLILCGTAGPAAEGVVPCLPEVGAAAQAKELAARVRPGDVVMAYEGSVALLEALVPHAEAAPDVTFVVNLFRPERGIDASGTFDETRRDELRAVGARLPANLRITADTAERVVLARRAGLPVRAAWALHSIVATVPPPSRGRRREGGPLRVLVPLRPGGFDPGPVGDVARVAHHLRRGTGDRVRISVTRPADPSLKARVRGDRLARLGVDLLVPSPDRTAYAAMFADHDVVWIAGGYGFTDGYTTQSSGKTLDALAAGVPVVGTAGTTTAREPLRWTGEPLGVDGWDQAADVLRSLIDRAGTLRARLSAQEDAIRAAYSPEATIRRVLEVAALTGDGWDEPLLDRPADLSTSAGRKAPNGATTAGPRRTGVDRVRSEVVVRRTVRIPVSRCARWALRQRLSRLKAALISRRRQAPPSSP